MRLTFDEIKNEIKKVLVKCGISEKRAGTCARIYTKTTYGGVYSHGTNRAARLVDYIQKGWVDVDAEPSLEREFGALRIYNGGMRPSVLSTLYRADRTMELADQYGVGMVGIRNTTRWIRGGTYGLYAARKGYAAIMWTSTEPCMPPWGGKGCRLDNDPFIMVVSSADGGEPLRLDMTMSQYSCGKLQVTRLAGEKLPYPGRFGDEGNLTDDPGAIEQSRHILPVGYQKGSAFSFMLNILGSVLTGDIGTTDMNQKGYGNRGSCSQVMIVVGPDRAATDAHMREVADTAALYIKNSAPSEEGGSVRMPDQGNARFYEEHDRLGIYVDSDVWKKIQSLQALGTGIRRFYP